MQIRFQGRDIHRVVCCGRLSTPQHIGLLQGSSRQNGTGSAQVATPSEIDHEFIRALRAAQAAPRKAAAVASGPLVEAAVASSSHGADAAEACQRNRAMNLTVSASMQQQRLLRVLRVCTAERPPESLQSLEQNR